MQDHDYSGKGPCCVTVGDFLLSCFFFFAFLIFSRTIVFNPSRGVHALNTLQGTPEEYLIGTVDQEMHGHRGDTNEMRFRMPVNTAVQHKRTNDKQGRIFAELEEKFSLMEDPLEPVKFMFQKPKEFNENPSAVAM